MANPIIPRAIDGVCACEVCCHRIWTSTYDCGLAAWSAPVLVSSATIAGSCPSDITWRNVVPGTPCVFQYDQYQALPDLCDDCDDVSPVPPAGPTSGAPSGCCNDCCCQWLFSAAFDCNTSTWVLDPLPTAGIQVPGACPPDGDWTDTMDCSATRFMYTTGPDPCEPGDPCGSPGTRPTPGLPAFYPVDCCEGDCCRTDWVWTYDCDSAAWVCLGIILQFGPTPCGVSGPWLPMDLCSVTYVSYTMPDDCSAALDCTVSPGPPDIDPDPGCCNPCCYRVWESCYSCDGPGGPEWSEPDQVGSTVVDQPCGSDSGWIPTGDPCCYQNTIYYTQDAFGDCPPPDFVPPPSGPGFEPPPGCCPEDPCVDCMGTQPNVVVSGFTGPCSGFNGSWAFSSFNDFADDCRWAWIVDGFPATLIYDKATMTWTAQLLIAGASAISITCSGGTLTGTFLGKDVGCGPTGDFAFG